MLLWLWPAGEHQPEAGDWDLKQKIEDLKGRGRMTCMLKNLTSLCLHTHA
jgi:hypothetical protein